MEARFQESDRLHRLWTESIAKFEARRRLDFQKQLEVVFVVNTNVLTRIQRHLDKLPFNDDFRRGL